MQEDPLKVLPQPVRDVPQIISGELSQPFQGSLIARIFLLNPAGLPVTPNLDHNLRLAKLWVFPVYSKLNPPLCWRKQGFVSLLSQPKLSLPPLAAKLFSTLKLGLAEEVGSSSRQEGHRFLLFLPKSPEIFQ